MPASKKILVLCFLGSLLSAGFVMGTPPRDDVTPPVTTATLNPPAPNGANNWYISNVNVTLTAIDNESGVNATFYRIDSGDIHIYTGPFTVVGDGIHTFEFYSVDNAGNVEPWHTQNVKIDTTPPTYTPYKHVSLTEYCFGADADDYGSGVNRVEFYFNGELVQNDSDPPYCCIIHPKWLFPKNSTMRIIAFDNAGLSISVGTIEFDLTHIKGIVTDVNCTNTSITFRAIFTLYNPANRNPCSPLPLPRLLLPKMYTYTNYDGEIKQHWIDIYLFPLPP